MESQWCRSFYFFIHNLGNIFRVYDSLNLKPTESLIKQMIQIYSRDTNVCPAIIQVRMQSTQAGGLFAIACAAYWLFSNNPAEVTDDQI